MKKNEYYSSQVPDGLNIPDTKSDELKLIGELVSNPEYIPTARRIISEKVFSDSSLKDVWRIINEMWDGHEAIDLLTVKAKVNDDTSVRLALNSDYTTELTVIGQSRALNQMATRRQLALEAVKLYNKAINPGGDYDELLTLPDNIASEVRDGAFGEPSTVPISDSLNSLASEIEQRQVNRESGGRNGIPTGIETLDYLIGLGFHPGNLIILSARPSVGKTGLMLQMALSASKSGSKATVYSLEMMNEELAQRLVASTELVTPSEITDGRVDWPNFEEANKQLETLPLFFNDKKRNITEITNDIILGRQIGRCDIAFIDYLGLIESSDQNFNDYQRIGRITRRLKAVAKQCRIPIVLLCQMNRNVEAETRPPRLSDLRDSGSIEQDADIVLMLERNPGADGCGKSLSNPEINMYVRKNRNGLVPEDAIPLVANKTFTKFSARQH